jgi:hypothetical protein
MKKLTIVLFVLPAVSFPNMACDTGSQAAPPAPPEQQITSGTHMGHTWSIDANHMMSWDGVPFIPYGAFSADPEGIEYLELNGQTPADFFLAHNMNMVNVWIDQDYLETLYPDQTMQDHIDWLNSDVQAYCDAGISVQLTFWIDGDPMAEDGSMLFDPGVRATVVQSWSDYISVTRHECVRTILLWNEINWWDWPSTYTPQQYGSVLGEYADEMRALIASDGQLPILFKIDASRVWNDIDIDATFLPVLEGAKRADGLLVDLWPTRPGDPRAAWLFRYVWENFNSAQTHTTAYYIGEGGKGVVDPVCVNNIDTGFYWDDWPPFISLEEARGILADYAAYGIKGHIYNGPLMHTLGSSASCSYEESYSYLQALASETIDLMVNTADNVDFSNAPSTPAPPPVECGEIPACMSAVVPAAPLGGILAMAVLMLAAGSIILRPSAESSELRQGRS